MDGTDGAYYLSEFRPVLLVGWTGCDIVPSREICGNVVNLFLLGYDFSDDSVLESIRDLMLAGF